MIEWLRLEGGLTPEIATPARRGADTVGARARHGHRRRRRPASAGGPAHTGFGKYLATEINMQTPMFQIVGGTDGIAARWRRRVGTITLGANVQAIEQPAGKVRVRYSTDGTPSKSKAHSASRRCL